MAAKRNEEKKSEKRIRHWCELGPWWMEPDAQIPAAGSFPYVPRAWPCLAWQFQ